MRLKKLETFLWVATLGSFRATAERMHTTQPAISARINGLEEELGVRLFERMHNTVALTAKGLELLPYAERIVRLNTEMEVAVAGSGSFTGTLRLGVAETIVHTWLPALMQRLHQLYPGIVVDLVVDTSKNMRDDLVARSLDLSFLMGPVSEPNMINLPLCRYKLIWVASPSLDLPDGPLHLSDLVDWPLIGYARQTRPHVDLTEALRATEGPMPRLYASSSLAATIRMAIDGIGISVLPPEVVQSELAEGILRRLDVSPALRDLEFTATYASTPSNPMAEFVANLAQEVVRDGGVNTP